MVNKAVVGVIGVILITTLGVGALVGLQGGGGPADAGDGTDGGDGGNGNDGGATGTTTSAGTATGTGTDPGGTNDGPTSTPGTTPVSTPTPSEYAVTLSSDEFTAEEIESNITSEINAWRRSEGLERLETGPGTIKSKLRTMAREHSAAMASAERVSHAIGNDTIISRYQSQGIYSTCSFKWSGSAIAQPGGDGRRQFEWIARTEVETTFSRDSGIRFHETESAVAKRIVDSWRGSGALEYGLLSSNYGKVGVGVDITSDGTVYATVDLCGK